MAANDGAVDHVLPVVGEPQFDQRVEHGIPDTLFSPPPEADVDRVPFAIALVHIPPGAPDPQNVQHSVEKTSVVVRRPRLPAALGRQQRANHRPLFVRQIAACQACLQKAALNQNSARLGIHYVNRT